MDHRFLLLLGLTGFAFLAADRYGIVDADGQSAALPDADELWAVAVSLAAPPLALLVLRHRAARPNGR